MRGAEGRVDSTFDQFDLEKANSYDGPAQRERFYFCSRPEGLQLHRGKEMSIEKPQITINLGRRKKTIEIGK